jgi:hypothetical protein
MTPLTLTRAPGPTEAKWHHNIKDPSPYLTVFYTSGRFGVGRRMQKISNSVTVIFVLP